MKRFTKKGQMAGAAVGNIITLVVGVGIGVLVLIFVGSISGSTYNVVESNINEIANNPIIAETFTASNVTTATLANRWVQENTIVIYNASETIGNGNFTIDATDGTILMDNPIYVANSTSLSINYTHGAAEVRQGIQDSIVSGFNALETTGDYLPLIVLAVVIAVVLGLVLGFAGIRGQAGGGGAL